MPAGGVGEFSTPALTLCADSSSASISPPLPHVKRPWSFCQKCRWQVTPKHAYSLDPSKSEWADHAATQEDNLSGNELLRNSSGNTRLQSSQLAEPLWTDPGLKSGISVHELISTLKKKKSTGGEWIVKHFPKILTRDERATIRTCFLSSLFLMSLITLSYMDLLFPQLTVSDVTDNFSLSGLHCVWCHW